MSHRERYLAVLGVVFMTVGLSAPLLEQGCGRQIEPQTAAAAFQQVCLAAMAVEAEGRHLDLTERALRYCSDPALPARIVTLLEVAQHLSDGDEADAGL